MIETIAERPAMLDDRRIGRLLVDQRVLIGVSEPPGFGYPEGLDVLRARIVDVGEEKGDAGSQWIEVGLDPGFEAPEGARVAAMVGTDRHESERGILPRLASGEAVTLSFDYAASVPPKRRDPDRYPALVGSVRLA